jgi:L-threonylcarbamoyladenylate synthase
LLLHPIFIYQTQNASGNQDEQPKISHLVHSTIFRKLFFGIFLGTFAGLLIIGSLRIIGAHNSISNHNLILGISLFAITNFLGRLTWGFLSDHLGASLSIFLGLLFQSISIIALNLSPLTDTMYLIIASSIGFGFGGNFVLFAKETAQIYGVKNLGITYPYVFLGYAIAGIAGPFSGGIIYDLTGSFYYGIMLASIMSLMGSLLFLKHYLQKSSEMLSNNLDIAAQFIQDGKLVAFPTETVYGLGANALNPLAVARIFELKERPSFAPLIVHISDFVQLDHLVLRLEKRVLKLAEIFWPGPLTIVLPKSSIVPDIVTSGLPTVGIRMPDSKVALELIKKSNCPIAAPSANKFGRISPTTAEHVKKQLPNVDYILDYGKTAVGIESTIIELTISGFQILRNGIITQEELENVIPFDVNSKISKISAPGMFKSHYSPKKMFIVSNNCTIKYDKSRAGLISFTGELESGYRKVKRVSERKDLRDYAVNLFEAMHSFEDDGEIDVIVAERVDETGIGKAIMDRLRKAEYIWQQKLLQI